MPLRVQAADCIAGRTRLIVLAKLAVDSAARVLIPAKGLEKESTIVTKQIGFDDYDTRQGGSNEVHDRLGVLLEYAKEIFAVAAVDH